MFSNIQVSCKKLRCSANEHKICTVSWDNEINVQYIHAQYVPNGVNEYMIVLSHNYHDTVCICAYSVHVHVHTCTCTIYVHVQLSGVLTVYLSIYMYKH